MPRFSFEEAIASYEKKQPRPYQAACLQEMIPALNAGKDVILRLPTGAGKSHTYLPVVAQASNSGLRTCILCSTKDNQRQVYEYSKDFKLAEQPELIFGINEYTCARTKEPADYLIWNNECKKCEVVDYKCEVAEANQIYGDSRFVITNFSKFLSVQPSNEFDLIVVDDSQGFENAVDQHFQKTIRYGKIDDLCYKYGEDSSVGTFLSNFLGIFDDAFDIMPPDRRQLDMRLGGDIITRFATDVTQSQNTDLFRYFREIDRWDRSSCQEVAYFVEACRRATQYTFYIRKDYYAPNDPNGAEVISRMSERLHEMIVKSRFGDAKIIFSSGTVEQPLVHTRSCTFRNYSNNDVLVVPSEEPPIVQNWFNQLHILEVQDIGSFKDRDHFPKALELALSLLRHTHVKTLLLFKNYREQITARDAIEGKLNREVGFVDESYTPEDIRELIDKVNIIVASASSRLWEGINIKNLDLELIFDLPFIKPPVHIDEQRAWSYNRRKMLIRLQQGIGRLIRAENEFGMSVVFDDRFSKYKRDRLFSSKLKKQVQPINSADLIPTVKTLLEEFGGRVE